MTLDRFHRVPGGQACRGFEAAATDSFWNVGKFTVHSYYIHGLSGHRKDRTKGGGKWVFACAFAVVSCVSRLGGIMALLIPLWSSVFLLPSPFSNFFFPFFSAVFGCLHFYRFVWREDGRGKDR